MEKGPARCWPTSCSKPRACSFQQQPGRANQILTYSLFNTQGMLFSATTRRVNQMLTYSLFKTQRMFLSASTRKGRTDADLHSIQNPEHDLISNNQEGPDIYWFTCCSIPRAWSCQKQPEMANQIIALHPVKNPKHAFVSNNQEGPARCWLTSCSKPRAYSCQQQPGKTSQMLTYILFETQCMLLSASVDAFKQNINLHSVYNQSTPLLKSSWDQPDIGLLAV